MVPGTNNRPNRQNRHNRPNRHNRKMKVLAVDTSTRNLSISVIEGSDILAETDKFDEKNRSDHLIPSIEKILSSSGLDIKDIGLFCTGTGPGSFTGLRIGVTAMRSLSIALKRPIMGVPSFDACAYNCFGHEKDICVMFDAKQAKVYARIYRENKKGLKPISPFLLDSADKIISKIKKETIVTGDAIKIYKTEILKRAKSKFEFAPEPLWYPKASIIARLGLKEYDLKHKGHSPFNLAPLYIYPKECQVKK